MTCRAASQEEHSICPWTVDGDDDSLFFCQPIRIDKFAGSIFLDNSIGDDDDEALNHFLLFYNYCNKGGM